MKRTACLSLLFVAAIPVFPQTTVVIQPQPQPGLVVLPAGKTKADYLGDFVRSLNDRQERERQRQHELQMQREWLAAQPQPQQPPKAADAAKIDFILQTVCDTLPVVVRDTSLTYGTFNGRMWTSMSRAQRPLYIEGILDVVRLAQLPNGSTFECPCTFGEMAIGIDQFYASDVAFQRLPIVFAMQMYVWRAKGETPDAVTANARSYLKQMELISQSN